MKQRLLEYLTAKQEDVPAMIAGSSSYEEVKGEYAFIPAKPMSKCKDILLIVHDDTVWADTLIKPMEAHGVICSVNPDAGIGADDRAGCYIAEVLHHRFGLPVLISHNEERGDSGTHEFVSTHQCHYDLLLSMDRKGYGYVTYGYDNKKVDEFLSSIGRAKENGTYSSISVVSAAIGIAGINFGTGYFNEHTTHETLVIGFVARAIEDASKTLEHFAGVCCPSETKRKDMYGWYFYGDKSDYRVWNDNPDNECESGRYIECERCGVFLEEGELENVVCDECLQELQDDYTPEEIQSYLTYLNYTRGATDQRTDIYARSEDE